jgi:sugar phosphate isomerase/epimerase
MIDLAAESGLSWVEMPAAILGGTSPDVLHAARGHAEERGVRFVFPGGKLDRETLVRDLQFAALLGAPTVRCTLSGVLCGDRRGFPGGWREHLRQCERELEAALPQAERLKVAIAMENHQDAGSHDLLALCRRFESPYLGITLDTGNPLAVMEDPLEFAARTAPYLKHAHLKDYRVYPAPNGFRLVRCAMGRGVAPFPKLFRLFDEQEWPITRTIEMGALHARLIPFLERSWWDEHTPRDARDALPALSTVWNNMRPAEEEWRTPLERGETGEELAAYEWEEYHASLEYVRRILAGEG